MISFIDLQAQQQRIRPQLDAAISRVLDHGQYIMGPEIFELEQKLSQYAGVKHTISCSNGTDALALVLMALGVKEKDAIFVPSFTFAATAEVVAWLGATPVFVDVLPDTYNMDPESLQEAIDLAKSLNLHPKGVIPVDLFGQVADYLKIEPIAQKEGLWILSDAAQSFGATYAGKKAGSWGHMATTSFFPAKPLGCYGEGGAIFTNDTALMEAICSLRIHGQGVHKYDNVRVGMNGRLETIQAAILLEKLKIFDEELTLRQKVADYYTHALKDTVVTPHVLENSRSSWAQYTIQLPSTLDREKVAEHLRDSGIPTAIYYHKGLHQQPAYAHYPSASMSTTEVLSNTVLSLPMHPYLTDAVQDNIIRGLLHAFEIQTFRLVG